MKTIAERVEDVAEVIKSTGKVERTEAKIVWQLIGVMSACARSGGVEN